MLDPPGQPELTTHHMSLPRILQRLEKLGYRVCFNEALSFDFLINSISDNNHSMSGLCRCHPTIIIFEQSYPLRSRNVAPALPYQYDSITTQAKNLIRG